MDKLDVIKKIFLVGLILFTAVLPGKVQNEATPFDLIPRIPQSDSPDSTITITTSSNPFDMIEILPSNRPVMPTTGFTVDQGKKPLTAREKTSRYQRFLFVTILTMMVILTLVVTIFRIFISKIWKAFLNDNLLSQLLREQSTGITLAYLILYFMFFINAGIFLFLVTKHFDFNIAESNIGTLLFCILAIAGFYSLKHLMLQVVGYVFPVDREVARYNFTVVVFNIIMAFFLVPMILFTAYAPPNLTTFIIYTTLGLFLTSLLFRGLRGLFIANRFFAWHKFHFFLYLCAVEIAPLLVIFKLIEQ